MEFDDGLDDDEPALPLLPPDDRLWRHPSEVAFSPATALPSRTTAITTRVWPVAVLAGTIGALLAAGIMFAARGERTRTVAVPALERQAYPVTVVAATGPPVIDTAAIAAKLRPAIVRVSGSRGAATVDGSGVMFRSDGFLLTDVHVIAGATALEVELSDRRRVPAKVVGDDPQTSVAVLKVGGYGYEVAALGSTSTVRVGDPAVVLGAASHAGDTPSVAVGSVQGVQRSVDTDDGQQLVGMIETDARVDGRASGGPVVDANGVVIGITTTKVRSADQALAGADGAQSGGYATAIELASSAADQLIAQGKAAHGWLGIDGRDLDNATARTLGVPGGAVVEKVHPASPASACGLAPGDIITAVDTKTVTSMGSLMMILRLYHPGDSVTLHVTRDNETRSITAVLQTAPAN